MRDDDDNGAKVKLKRSLGWLAQSASVPKRRKEIEGITQSSLIDLKAHVYERQERANEKELAGRAGSEATRERRGLKGLEQKSNKGVEERDRRDRKDLKGETTVAESREALERKAELYRELQRRGSRNVEEESERYNVDFLRKSHENGGEEEGVGGRESEYDRDDRGRRGFFARHDCITDVALRTAHERQRVLALKEKRRQLKESKRKKLKANFIQRVRKKRRENKTKLK